MTATRPPDAGWHTETSTAPRSGPVGIHGYGLIARENGLWELPMRGRMRVPGVVIGSRALVDTMDAKVLEQLASVATLPGIVGAALALPDAHWGYGFPIGSVAAFDAAAGGIVSAGGVGFDIACGVRCLLTGLREPDIAAVKVALADELAAHIPAGLGSRGAIRLRYHEMDAMLTGGARWAVREGWGVDADLERIEAHGQMLHAKPGEVSDLARRRQKEEMGTLGSGNHYLEVQVVDEVVNTRLADGFGLAEGDITVMIHCGSRGLGHQIGSEFLRRMAEEAPAHGIALPDRELACAPIDSSTGQAYLGAMRAAINCALANRQIIGHLTREAFARFFPDAHLALLHDVSHNTCKVETHTVDGRSRELHVHRKGATRALAPGHPELPLALRPFGQPVLIGGSMGSSSWVMAGCGLPLAFDSACHGAGRAMSRHEAMRRWQGRAVINALRGVGVEVRSPSLRGVAEEAPGAYKDVGAVVEAAAAAGLARRVARLRPLICIKG